MTLVTLFALAMALGGTLIGVLFGDRATRRLGLIPAALIVMVYVPAVASRPGLQLGVALAAAAVAMLMFVRAKRRRNALRAQSRETR